jgi:hypothetical protein
MVASWLNDGSMRPHYTTLPATGSVIAKRAPRPVFSASTRPPWWSATAVRAGRDQRLDAGAEEEIAECVVAIVQPLSCADDAYGSRQVNATRL